MIVVSDIDWFNDETYIGSSVSFSSSVWRLERKITEHEYYETQLDVEELGINSEARGVFISTKLSGNGPSTAVIKIRLQ